MAEKLSQSQIDDLLKSLTSGDTPPGEITMPEAKSKAKEYDFRSPKKMNKEQLRTLSGIYDNYARHVSSYLSGILRTFCKIEVDSIEEQRYYEYSNALPESVFMAIVEMSPLEGTTLFEISKPIVYAIIDRLLGGAAETLETGNDFTEIEQTIMEKIVRQIMVFLKDAWEQVVDVEPNFVRVETNSRLSQLMGLDDIVVIVLLNVTIRQITGTISICVPCNNLDSILEQLNSRFRLASRKKGKQDVEAQRQNMLINLKNSQLPVSAILGKTTLTIREVISLQAGDVIPLESSVDDDIQVRIGKFSWFAGIPGNRKNKKVVKISKLI